MTKKLRSDPNLEDYTKVELVIVTIKIPRIQHENLKRFADLTNAELTESAGRQFLEWAMPRIESMLRKYDANHSPLFVAPNDGSTSLRKQPMDHTVDLPSKSSVMPTKSTDLITPSPDQSAPRPPPETQPVLPSNQPPLANLQQPISATQPPIPRPIQPTPISVPTRSPMPPPTTNPSDDPMPRLSTPS